MKIIEVRAYEGKNIYCHRPVIKMRLDLEELDKVESKEKGNFNQRLVNLIPSLSNHFCSRGKIGGFIERLKEGTYFGHIIEHVALELQNLSGCPVIYGKTMREISDDGIYEIIMEYKVKEGAIRAAKSAVEIAMALLLEEIVDINKVIENIKDIVAVKDLGPSTKAIYQAAQERNIPIMRIGDGSILQMGYGKYQKKIEATITGKTNCIGVDIACNKALTKELLRETGIPIPEGAVAHTLEEALEIAEELEDNVVIKPFDGNQGKGVTLNISTKDEISKAFDVAKEISEQIIVERYYSGRNYRLIVVDGKVVAASERIPAFVVGDGEHNIKELVDIVNNDSLRGKDHEKPMTKIYIDSIVTEVLLKNNLTINSIPAKGEVVYLRESANLSTGGTAIDVTDQVHSDIAEIAVRAAKVIGLDVAGIDLVTKDIKLPLHISKGVIIEVNAAPGIRMHHYPCQGKTRDVAGAIIDYLFPEGSKSRIPIVSITGTNGKTTTTRLIGHILNIDGTNVGMTTTDGIYVNGKNILRGDNTGPQSAKVILKDPTVDVAVLETARGGLIKGGLGYDTSNVGIITNISSDHLGLNNIETLEDLAHVKALVAEAVDKDGYTVLNADDEMVVKLGKRAKSNIIYFSKSINNLYVRRQLGIGGTAVFIKDGYIVLAKGKLLKRIAAVRSIPITYGGIAQHNIENVLAAVAGCVGLEVPIKQIREGIMTFQANSKHNPGRLNIVEIDGVKIVIDYGHNEAGYSSIINMMKRFNAKRLIGVIGVPGDRLNEHIIKVGEIAGKGFDYVIIKEDSDTRGRDRGEVAALLREGVSKAGLSENKINTILCENTAVQYSLKHARQGDVIVVFYEKLDSVLDVIELNKVIKEKVLSKVKQLYKEEKGKIQEIAIQTLG